MTKQYQARNGRMQFKPSLEWIEGADNEGFCVACGETQGGVEPDARLYKCRACGECKVYGNETLAAMSLFY